MACRLCLYLRNWFVLADEAGDTLIGGSPHETISSALGRATEAGQRWARWVCRVLGWIARNPNHCLDSILPDDDCDTVEKL